VADVPVAFALIAPFGAGTARGTPLTTAFDDEGLGLLDPPVTRTRGGRTVRIGPRTIGDGGVLVEIPLLAPISDTDGFRRELDLQAGVRVPEETRADLVSVDLSTTEEIGPLAALRSSMELVAPRVALSVRVATSLWQSASEADLDRLFEAAHRVHVRFTAPTPEGGWKRLAGLLERTSRSRAALLVEFASDRGAFRDVLEAVRETVERRRGQEDRWMIAVDPCGEVGPLLAVRRIVRELTDSGHGVPLVLIDRPAERGADPLLAPAANLGGLLCEGIGDAIQVETASAVDSRRLAFNILQVTRIRMTKTEFISCPSCGRTLFDLESTTAAIKEKTGHLKGLKIAVMGCIVNGPGEMADADFGYVGWGDDKIALFVGKDMVAKDVPTHEAADRLVELIKSHGKWVEPPVAAE
jgi:(E)-4-hydroxy-3-methylbut-2-enyl-diphosphate synthase